MSLVNIQEKHRQSPEAWVTVGMIPHYSSSVDSRPSAGGNSSSMRQCELIQACYHLLLSSFIDKTKETLPHDMSGHRLMTSMNVNGRADEKGANGQIMECGSPLYYVNKYAMMWSNETQIEDEDMDMS